MDLRNLITEKEYEAMDKYRQTFALDDSSSIERFVSSKDLLGLWEENKSIFLNTLFQDKLILEKEVCIQAPKKYLCKTLQEIFEHNYVAHNVLKTIRTIINELVAVNRKTNDNLNFDLTYYLTDYTSLVCNKIELSHSVTLHRADKPDIVINSGMKTMKLLQKIAKEYNVANFEDLRQAQALATNQKTITGKLCLSIHPLDYMTMSDNNLNWSSCMSWQEGGCYRLGTVEMMNSPMVIVAYLKDEQDIYITDNFQWNNKKWRILLLATPQFITAIKGYPYQNDELETKCLDWLEALGVNSNVYYNNHCLTNEDGVAFYNNTNKVYFSTDFMYNDYNLNVQPIRFSDENMKQYIGKFDGDVEFNYSGPAQCMCCGTADYDALAEANQDEAVSLCCCNCTYVEQDKYCDYCGERIYEGDDIYTINDYEICEHCYNNFVVEEAHHGAETFLNNTTEIDIDCGFDYGKVNIYIENYDKINFFRGYSKIDGIQDKTYKNYFEISIADVTEKMWFDFNLDNYIDISYVDKDLIPKFLREETDNNE